MIPAFQAAGIGLIGSGQEGPYWYNEGDRGGSAELSTDDKTAYNGVAEAGWVRGHVGWTSGRFAVQWEVLACTTGLSQLNLGVAASDYVFSLLDCPTNLSTGTIGNCAAVGFGNDSGGGGTEGYKLLTDQGSTEAREATVLVDPGDVITCFVDLNHSATLGLMSVYHSNGYYLACGTFTKNSKTWMPFTWMEAGSADISVTMRVFAEEMDAAPGIDLSHRGWSQLARDTNPLWLPADLSLRMDYFDPSVECGALTLVTGNASYLPSTTRPCEMNEADLLAGVGAYEQPTSGNRPTTTTSFFNGHRALLFDGSDDFMQQLDSNNNSAFTKNTSSASAFAVYAIDPSDVAATGRCLAQWSNPAANTSKFAINAGNGTAAAGCTPSLGARRTSADSSASLVAVAAYEGENMLYGVVDYTNADGFLYLNDALDNSSLSFTTAGTTENVNSTYIKIGAVGASNTSPFVGPIGLLIPIYGILGTDERNKLAGWAAARFGMQGSLDGGHPYAGAAPLYLD